MLPLFQRGSVHSTKNQSPIEFGHELFPKLYGYVECFSDVSTERDSDWEATFNPGLIYNLTDNVGFKLGVSAG